MENSWQSFWNGVLEINNVHNLMTVCAAVLVGFLLGLLIYGTYKMTCRKFLYDREFGLVLFLVPIVVALLLSVIGSNIGRAFSLAGALSIVRYRSTLMTPRNIALVFFSMGAGFITGCGLYIPAFLFVLITCLIIIGYTVLTGEKGTKKGKTLLISVPEEINYDGLFDDVLDTYTLSRELLSIGVASAGTVIELRYRVELKSETDTKAFLDELRTRNGNFKIQLMQLVPERVIGY